jgi:hypothetical protein
MKENDNGRAADVTDSQDTPHQTGFWRSLIPSQILLALVVWVTHFFHARQFGLYEDDWSRIPYTAGIRWLQLWRLIWASTVTPDLSQGRPLHPAFIYIFSFLGFKSGSLTGLYAIALTIAIANSLLFHSFLLKVYRDTRFALLGALAFCVFPADTTQAFLTHALGVQTAICLLLIAFHFYLTGWKKISYFVILVMLFNYETPFLVFAVAPLLGPRPKWALTKHWIAMACILLCSVAYRSTTGEDRVAHMGARQVFLGTSNMLTGPLTCLAMYIYRPIEAAVKLRGADWLVTLLSITAFAAIFFALYVSRRYFINFAPSGGFARTTEHSGDDERQFRLGLVMLLLAYPLTLTTVGISIAGLGTRVHTAAIFGGSTLCAWICSDFLSRVSNARRRYLRILCVACFYGLLLGFGLTVQHDYAIGWTEQREFWTDLLALCPPLDNGDVVLLDPKGLRDTRQLLFLRKDVNGVPETRQIRSLDNVVLGLPALYDFPSTWTLRPQVFRLPPNWEKQIFVEGDMMRLLTVEAPYFFDPRSRGPVSPSHVIFVDTKDGLLTLRDKVLDPQDGSWMRLKTNANAPSDVQRSAFYHYVVYPSDVKPVPYLVK